MIELGSLRDKIPSPELLRIAEEDSGTHVSVIIQLDLPQRRVEVGQVPGRATTSHVLLGILPQSAVEQETAEQRISEARGFLEELLGTPPRWLRSSHSFVASVTPDQLRSIARLNVTKTIWPNRQHTTGTVSRFHE